MDKKFKNFMETRNKSKYLDLKVSSYDYIKLSNKSRYTNDIVRNALNNKIIPFPRFDSFDLKKQTDWNSLNEKYGKSYQLYIHSLRFVNELLLQYESSNDIKYAKKASSYLKSWVDFVCECKTSSMVWYDHSAAQRTQVLLYFWHLTSELNLFDSNEFGSILEYHAYFLAEDAVYHRTNHGLMMDRSLMALGIVLENNNIFNVGYYRSIDTFWFSFSSKGLHLENSPGYHNMVVKMYRQIEEFLEYHDKTYGEIINSTLDNADQLKGIITQPNNLLPPIGDTGNRIAQEKTNFANLIDYEAGLCVIQNETLKTYLTFISGYSSITHKHFDDLSITYSLQGKTFLQDPGRYNYSRHAFRKYVKSSKAHSSFYIEGEEYSLNSNNRFDRSTTFNFHLENENMVHVKGTNNAFNQASLSRQIVYLKEENVLLIIDGGQTKRNGRVIHNYNLGSEVSPIEIGEEKYILSNDGSEIFLKCYNNSVNHEVTQGNSSIENPVALNSPDFNEVDLTHQIKFYSDMSSLEKKPVIFTLSSEKDIDVKCYSQDSLIKVSINNKEYYINY